jgi:hypothetical protein
MTFTTKPKRRIIAEPVGPPVSVPVPEPVEAPAEAPPTPASPT